MISRILRWSGFGLIFLPVLAWSQNYRVTVLPTAAGFTSDAGAIINNAGVVLVQDQFEDYTVSGSTILVLSSYGSDSTIADGFGNVGPVGLAQTGFDSSFGDLYTAVAWSGATPYLTSLGGTSNWANAINDSGETVGDSETFPDRVTVIRAETYISGQVSALSTPGSTYASSSADCVSGTGIVGGSVSPNGLSSAIAAIWANGQLQELPALSTSDTWCQVTAVNASGQAAVYDRVSHDDQEAGTQSGFWSNGALTSLGNAGGIQTDAVSMNDFGEIVGRTTDSQGLYHSFYWSQATGMALLDNLFVGTALPNFTVNSINNSGQIVGVAYGNSSGVGYAVLLTPYDVDEPTSYSIYRGVYYSGSLSSLFSIDSTYLEVLTGPTLNPQEPPVSVIVNGTSSVASPSDLRLSMTAHVNTPGLTQTIELWDFQASAWVTAGSQSAKTTNNAQTAIATNPPRFVQTGTNAIRARVSWKQTGPTLIYRWAAYMDQVVWNVSL